MKNKKKDLLLRLGALLLALLLLAGIAWFANALLGNPISRALVKRNAARYLGEHYASLGYELDSVSYSFKTGGYLVHLTCPDSMDGDFTLSFGMAGNLTGDDYGSRVSGHGNIVRRLDMAYRARVDEVLESASYPYEIDFAYGSLDFDREAGEEADPLALSRDALENDRFYDVSELGKTNGTLVLYIESDTVDLQTAGEVLITTKRLLSDAGVGFRRVDLVLRYPLYGEGSARPEGSIRVEGFLAEDIEPDGIEEKLRAACEEAAGRDEDADKAFAVN